MSQKSYKFKNVHIVGWTVYCLYEVFQLNEYTNEWESIGVKSEVVCLKDIVPKIEPAYVPPQEED